jgi:hypothetical protein
LHTFGNPFAHWSDTLQPGATLDCPLLTTVGTDEGLYDHDYNTDAHFYMVVTPVGG